MVVWPHGETPASAPQGPRGRAFGLCSSVQWRQEWGKPGGRNPCVALPVQLLLPWEFGQRTNCRLRAPSCTRQRNDAPASQNVSCPHHSSLSDARGDPVALACQAGC